MLCLSIGILNMNADIIILKDGNTLQVYNVEPASKWVYYTDTDEADAPVKKVSIDNVFAYKIGDGELTTIEKSNKETKEDPSKITEELSPKQVEAKPSANNDALITAYNSHPQLVHNKKKAQTDKHTETFLSLWGIEDGSILSDDNVEITFEKMYSTIMKKQCVVGIKIKINNKTDSPLYIDLASTFKILNGGYAEPYFTNSVYSEGNSVTNGGSLNLGALAGALNIGGAIGTLAGGINVGKYNTKSTEISRGEQRILVVPPHSSVFLPGDKVSNGTNIKECYEPLLFNNKGIDNASMALGMARDVMEKLETTQLTILQDGQSQKIQDSPNATSSSLGICRWHQTSYSPENSPKKIGRIITYSTSPDFSTYTVLPVNIYMRGAFGVKVMLVGDDLYSAENYNVITDNDHFLVGPGFVNK